MNELGDRSAHFKNSRGRKKSYHPKKQEERPQEDREGKTVKGSPRRGDREGETVKGSPSQTRGLGGPQAPPARRRTQGVGPEPCRPSSPGEELCWLGASF